jgi:mannose-1-phosphate guanylyltransferase
MRPLIRYWLGENRPKQYCTFVGSRSMFQHTVDRARSVVSDERVVTIVAGGHRRFLSEAAHGYPPGLVIEQPSNLGTAPGILLPATYVLANDPDATFVFLPTDHFVYPEDRFAHHVGRALDLAEQFQDQIILVGATPDRAETDYGWIDQERTGMPERDDYPYGSRKVASFREKPVAREARVFLRQGCLWNTMVMAVKANTLWGLCRQFLPEMTCKFHAFLLVLRAIREGRLKPEHEATALARLYQELTPADFSKDLLQHVPDRSLVLPMDGIDWCDWGRPWRVTETLARLKRQPLFPTDYHNYVLLPETVANESPL